jgi:hypothetical protein
LNPIKTSQEHLATLKQVEALFKQDEALMQELKEQLSQDEEEDSF